MADTVLRLDKSEPPPGYAFLGHDRNLCGRWDGDQLAGAPVRLTAAWAHYQERNDPPGMFVDRRGTVMVLPAAGLVILDAADHAVGRQAAWAWAWQRVAVAAALSSPHVVAWAEVPDRALVRTRRDGEDGDTLTNFYVRRNNRGWWVGGNGSLARPDDYEFVQLVPAGNAWPFWEDWRKSDKATATVIALVGGHETACELHRIVKARETDWWPRCLAWPDEEVTEVERWLAEGGELPGVLRG